MEKLTKVNRSLAENLKTLYLESPVGLIEVQSSERGVRAVSFVEERHFDTEENVHNLLTIKQLFEYFDGKRKVFDLVFDDEVCVSV